MDGGREVPTGLNIGTGTRSYDGIRPREDPYVQTYALNSDSDTPPQTARNDFHEPRAHRNEQIYRPVPHIQPESGTNMLNFLRNFELIFADAGIPLERWGYDVRQYLTGDAMTLWFHLYDTNFDFRDWKEVKKHLLDRFCRASKEAIKLRLCKLKWEGSAAKYSSDFISIISQGETLPNEKLVAYYLANLPVDIYEKITKSGHVRFERWEDAAVVLREVVGCWDEALEYYRQTQREMQHALMNSREHGLSKREIGTRGYTGERAAQTRSQVMRTECYACRGRGHAANSCPSRSETTKRPGEMCRRCGGMGHYASTCPTPDSRRNIATPKPEYPLTRPKPEYPPSRPPPNAASRRLNEQA